MPNNTLDVLAGVCSVDNIDGKSMGWLIPYVIMVRVIITFSELCANKEDNYPRAGSANTLRHNVYVRYKSTYNTFDGLKCVDFCAKLVRYFQIKWSSQVALLLNCLVAPDKYWFFFLFLESIQCQPLFLFCACLPRSWRLFACGHWKTLLDIGTHLTITSMEVYWVCEKYSWRQKVLALAERRKNALISLSTKRNICFWLFILHLRDYPLSFGAFILC